jgi:hypothetical protein
MRKVLQNWFLNRLSAVSEPSSLKRVGYQSALHKGSSSFLYHLLFIPPTMLLSASKGSIDDTHANSGIDKSPLVIFADAICFVSDTSGIFGSHVPWIEIAHV